MRKSNILCKSLSTVESLGAVNVIASDKTGTLTQNRMSVVNVGFGAQSQASTEEARAFVSAGARGMLCIRTLAAIAGLCNDATFETMHADEPLELKKINGDATGVLALYCTIFEGVLTTLWFRRQWTSEIFREHVSHRRYSITMDRSWQGSI